jgi:hypothetical protein
VEPLPQLEEIHRRSKEALWKLLMQRLIIAKRQEIPFIVFAAFLLTFVVARLYVYLTNSDIMSVPFLIGGSLIIRGIHIHHLNWGIFILAITGFLSLYDVRPRIHRILAVFYGIGLGLTFDEFALWLRLRDDYSARITFEAITIISLILLNLLYFPGFWKRMGRRITRLLLFLLGKKRLPSPRNIATNG